MKVYFSYVGYTLSFWISILKASPHSKELLEPCLIYLSHGLTLTTSILDSSSLERLWTLSRSRGRKRMDTVTSTTRGPHTPAQEVHSWYGSPPEWLKLSTMSHRACAQMTTFIPDPCTYMVTSPGPVLPMHPTCHIHDEYTRVRHLALMHKHPLTHTQSH